MKPNENPARRLEEILAQRVKVQKAEEKLASAADKVAKAKSNHSVAASELTEARHVLDDIIDDRPAGPLFPGRAELDGDQSAGDGPIDELPRASGPGAATGASSATERDLEAEETSLQKVEAQAQARRKTAGFESGVPAKSHEDGSGSSLSGENEKSGSARERKPGRPAKLKK